MKPLTFVAVTKSLGSSMVGEEAFKLPDLPESLLLLLDGVKAATAGFSWDLTLIGVTRCASTGLTKGIGRPTVGEGEVAVWMVSSFVTSVEWITVRFG